MTRQQAKERLLALGARVTGSVSGTTDGLIAGARPGSKVARAEKLQVPILDEAALEELVRGNETP